MSRIEKLKRAIIYKNGIAVSHEMYPNGAETAFLILRMLQPEVEAP